MRIGLFAVLVAAGVGIVFAPEWVAFGLFGAVLVTGVVWSGRRQPWWMTLGMGVVLFVTLFNYGAVNVPVPGVGMPLVHAVLFVVLLGAYGAAGKDWLKLPVPKAWLWLFLLTLPRLLASVADYGLWAVRDATVVIEGVMMLFGIAWARADEGFASVRRFIGMVTVLVAAYAVTFPFGATVRAISPVSGIFKVVPVMGFYTTTAVTLVACAVWAFSARSGVKGWVATVGGGALLGLALLFQERTIYLAVPLVMLWIGRTFGVGRAYRSLVVSVVVIALLLAASAGVVRGRLGSISPEFYIEHLSSLAGDPDAPGAGSLAQRLDWARDTLATWSSSLPYIVWGEGFGFALIDFKLSATAVVRDPHNTFLTVLLRTGVIGFAAWMVVIVMLLLHAGRRAMEAQGDVVRTQVVAWLSTLLLLSLVKTIGQPYLEFSFGGLVFWAMAGYLVGMPPVTADVTAIEAAGDE